MAEKKTWVDFRAVKEAVSMQMVLDHYREKTELIPELKRKGDELRGPCPMSGCDGTRSFTVNLTKNAFNCFSCKARGNVLDFVAKLEGVTVTDAARMLQSWFKVGEDGQHAAALPSEGQTAAAIARGIYENARGHLFEVVIPSAVAEDLEEMAVYRELFGEYRYHIATVDLFRDTEEYGPAAFRLVKAL